MAFPKIDDVQLDFGNWGKGLAGTIAIGTNGNLSTFQLGDSATSVELSLPGSASKVIVPTIEVTTISETGASEILVDKLTVNEVATLTAIPGQSINIRAQATPLSSIVVDGTSGNVSLADTWTITYGGDTTTSGALTINNAGGLTIGAGGGLSVAGNATITGTATISGGTLELNGTTNTLSVTTDLTVNANIDATAGLDVTGGPLTVTNQNLTHTGTGTVSFAGAVAASGGLTVSGAALTIDNQPITQNIGGQVTFAGNVDANGGIDVTGLLSVTGGAFTVGGRTVADIYGSPDSALDNFTATAGQTNFSLTNTPRAHTGGETAAAAYAKSNLRAYVNGQRVINYTMDATYGNTVIFDTGVQEGAEVVVEYLK